MMLKRGVLLMLALLLMLLPLTVQKADARQIERLLEAARNKRSRLINYKIKKKEIIT